MNQHFQNGCEKARQEIENKLSGKFSNEMALSIEKIKQLSRDGVLELNTDVEGKRNGQHIEVVLLSPNGMRTKKWVRIEN